MGRGTILADLGEGQYSIKLDFGESRLAAQLSLLTGANTELDTQIAAQQAKVNAAQAALNASNAALAAAINAYVAGNSSPNLLPPMETAKLDQVAKEEVLRRETVALGKLQGTKTNNLRKIDDLNSYRASLTLNAWCADYTEGASGEVATLEIPNEPKTVLIAPAGRAPVDADGELRMRALMTAPQAYYNAAILPGWQKFKPTYRSGTITAIDGDTADVALDEAKSSASGIANIGLANIEFDVNQSTTLENVPIVYQDCNGSAFQIGDSVVIQFMSQNWSTPRIIGFLSNPRACGPWISFSKTIYYEDVPPYSWTAGIASFGTFGNGGRYFPSIWKNGGNFGGDRVWVGADKKIVTWRAGGDGFNYPYVVYNNQIIDCDTVEFYNYKSTAFIQNPALNNNLFSIYHVGFSVVGAAVYVENNQDILYFVCYEKPYPWIGFGPSYASYGLLPYLEKLHFYKKNLSTGILTKITTKELLFAEFVAAPSGSGRDRDATYPGNCVIHITDAKNTPLLNQPVSGFGASPAWYGGYVDPGTGNYAMRGNAYKVSFHPSEVKATCAVYQSWQTGRLEFTESSTTFYPEAGLVAVEYHPNDGHLCKLIISNFDWANSTYIATFTESNYQVESTAQIKRGFLGDLSVCYPQNTVLIERNVTNQTYSRNFFNGAYIDNGPAANTAYKANIPLLMFDYANILFNGWLNLGKVKEETLNLLTNQVRMILYKNKYYALFYENPDFFAVKPTLKFISSEFTQQNFEANAPFTLNEYDVNDLIRIPIRLGFLAS